MRTYRVEGLSRADGSARTVEIQAATPSEALLQAAEQGIDLARTTLENPVPEHRSSGSFPPLPPVCIPAGVRLAAIAVLAVAAGYLLFAPVRAERRALAARTLQLDLQRDMIRRTAEDADRREAEERANPYRLYHYRALRTGMSYTEAAELLGRSGTELSSVAMGGVVARVYSWSNADGSNMICTFENDRLVGKSQFALRH